MVLDTASNGDGAIDVGYTSAGSGGSYPPTGYGGGWLFGTVAPALTTIGQGRKGTGYGSGRGGVGGISSLGGDGMPGILIVQWVA